MKVQCTSRASPLTAECNCTASYTCSPLMISHRKFTGLQFGPLKKKIGSDEESTIISWS